MSLLVDTSALYALLDADDVNHARAAAFLPALPDREPFVHNYVVVETTALAARRFGHRAVRALQEDLLPALDRVWVDQRIHDDAVAATLAAPRSAVSLVDRVSFEVMRDLGVTDAFAFDADFTRAGFVTLPR
jgi:predicted nucleic acid-binding protein